jgi:hypothetical protein
MTPRKVPFATDKERTATDMMLATAYNISVSLVNLVNLMERLEKRVENEERTKGMKAFSITVTVPNESEWTKTEEAPKNEQPPQPSPEVKTNPGETPVAEPPGTPVENPPEEKQ